MKAGRVLLRKLKDVFRRHQSQLVGRVVSLINPILRGWVNYFAVGNSSECFSFIKDWVEKKIRRHLIAMPAVGGHRPPTLGSRHLHACLLHQPPGFSSSHCKSLRLKRFGHATAAITGAGRRGNGLDSS